MKLAAPGQIIQLLEQTEEKGSKPQQIVNGEFMRVMRLELPKGKRLAEHKAPGEITVQCVSGEVEFSTMGFTQTMTPGTMLFLESGELHALEAKQDSTIILTIVKPLG